MEFIGRHAGDKKTLKFYWPSTGQEHSVPSFQQDDEAKLVPVEAAPMPKCEQSMLDDVPVDVKDALDDFFKETDGWEADHETTHSDDFLTAAFQAGNDPSVSFPDQEVALQPDGASHPDGALHPDVALPTGGWLTSCLDMETEGNVDLQEDCLLQILGSPPCETLAVEGLQKDAFLPLSSTDGKFLDAWTDDFTPDEDFTSNSQETLTVEQRLAIAEEKNEERDRIIEKLQDRLALMDQILQQLTMRINTDVRMINTDVRKLQEHFLTLEHRVGSRFQRVETIAQHATYLSRMQSSEQCSALDAMLNRIYPLGRSSIAALGLISFFNSLVQKGTLVRNERSALPAKPLVRLLAQATARGGLKQEDATTEALTEVLILFLKEACGLQMFFGAGHPVLCYRASYRNLQHVLIGWDLAHSAPLLIGAK